MAALHKNRVSMSVTGTPGTGTITLASAVSGYQSFATAYGANATVDLLYVDGTAWGIERGCSYVNSGTTITRGTHEESSTGSALSLTSAAVVSVILSASKGNLLEALLQSTIPGGRLTLTTGVPVTTSDVTGATSIYYTPYMHNCIVLWDGARWSPTTFTEVTLALGTLTSGKPYDVFGYLSSGALATELLAWTNDTTRATAVTLQDGRYCKSGDQTRLLLGTFYTTATTTTEDSAKKRLLWNAYNRESRQILVADAATSWSYGTAAWRAANNNSANRAQVLQGLPGASMLSMMVIALGSSAGSGGVPLASFGEDSTTTLCADCIGAYSANIGLAVTPAGGAVPPFSSLRKCPAVGFHYYQWIEYAEIAGLTIYGTLTIHKSGISGEYRA